MGVTKGLAGIKLSGSLKKYGFKNIKINKIKKKIKNPSISLNKK